MPNWCENRLDIFGSRENLQKFMMDVNAQELKGNNMEGEVLSFAKIRPQPKKLKDWYNWNIKNWGTKWDASSTACADWSNEPDKEMPLDDSPDKEKSILYDFLTAWGPPVSWIKYVAKKYPKLKFKLEYYEGGCDFFGKYYVNNKEVILDECTNTEGMTHEEKVSWGIEEE